MTRGWTPLVLVFSAFFGCVACEQRTLASQNAPEGASSSGLVREGSAAPDFQVIAHSGARVSLSALRGKPVVLYFYPKDDTPGCTTQAREYRDEYRDFEGANTAVLGVSADDNQSHAQFAEKHQLPFLLLPDPEHEIARAYGVPTRFGVTKRVTFVIDREGKIAKVFDEVNPKGHATEVLKVVQSL